MDIQVMNTDVHNPAFIRAGQSNDTRKEEPQGSPMTPMLHIRWSRIIELTLLIAIIVDAVYLLSKLVTPQVVTAVTVIAGFLILRFIVRVILKVTFTLLSFLFWLAILCAILLCVL
ncbi:hypothetical protein PG_0814 [Porphyromonas gingivalis W83]|uniref:Uncharacterized protein n=1 Tax=Porphyromonas gingivalis (strain ATCC BAA-308 / W83) TaxID=242619 RepID=Q7MW35_PORGI|nr:hypothetical protein [Porphyromonas gingivalis]AAQ65971.1 hypothetical protein PG_0814 [Porphyromonas gingivalis W83]AKV64352.1 hypothetical protein PGA7_00011390 [Porphyromonas gingivalis]USI94822.1 hypothetical protein MCS24_04320 [Porphyromonas gingivalis]USI96612.1 hypothetical protein MCS27_03690 [Porphyromonas gingivalis]USI98521.1 hypothetical protein MCS25_03695 [Porphyromonas gingivalis]